MTITRTVILALDLAMKQTGVAIGSPDRGPFHWETFKTEDWHFHRPQWCRTFWDFLHHLHATHNLTHIAYEDTFLVADRIAPEHIKAQQFFVAIIMLFTQLHCLKLMPVPVNTWRAFFLPGHKPTADKTKSAGSQRYQKRKQNKLASIDKCKSLGWEVANDDEAEAIAILCWAMVKVNPNAIELIDPIFKRKSAGYA